MKPDPKWLLNHCACCGHPYPRSKPQRAGYFTESRQLLCLCETREPPQPVRTHKQFSELTQAELEELINNVKMPEPHKGGLPIDL